MGFTQLTLAALSIAFLAGDDPNSYFSLWKWWLLFFFQYKRCDNRTHRYHGNYDWGSLLWRQRGLFAAFLLPFFCNNAFSPQFVWFELQPYGIYYAPLLAFFTGIIVFICGNLRLGFLIDFISQPVIAGFTSGAAITIASGQIKVQKWLLKTQTIGCIKTFESLSTSFAESTWYCYRTQVSHARRHCWLLRGHSEQVRQQRRWYPNFFKMLSLTIFSIHNIKWEDTVLGIICAIILLSLRVSFHTSCVSLS